MRSILRSFLTFLDKRFPEKVVLSQQDYENLKKRVVFLEGEVTKFNAALGFAGSIKAAMGSGGFLQR